MPLYEYCSSNDHQLSNTFKRYGDNGIYCGYSNMEEKCSYSRLNNSKQLFECKKPTKEQEDSIDSIIIESLNNTGALK